MVRIAIGFYSCFLLLAIGITAIWGDWTSWFPVRDTLGYAQDVATGVAVGLLIVLGSQWLMPRLKLGRMLTMEFRQMLGPLRTHEVAILALSSGLAEEALFRAALQPLWGFVICSLLFGLLHVGHKRAYLVWTLFALAFGFLIGALYEWRGGLLLPFCIHATVNFCNMKWIVSYRDEGWREEGAM